MIAALLPPGVHAAECGGGEIDELLFPEESAYLARAVESRRHEFTAVRRCARFALGELGIDRPPLVPGRRGEPSWPEGVVGSMTHCEGYRAAAVGRSGVIGMLGIDAEPNLPLPDGVLQTVASPVEQRRLRVLAHHNPPINWDRLLFSAKESVYKAWFPVRGTMLDFADADLAIAPDGRFVARLIGMAERDTLGPIRGRWACDDKLLVTVVAVASSKRG